MADGMKLLLKRARLPARDLYLPPEGSKVKCSWRGWLGSCAMVCALRVMAWLLRSDRLGVGRPVILETVCVKFVFVGGW